MITVNSILNQRTIVERDIEYRNNDASKWNSRGMVKFGLEYRNNVESQQKGRSIVESVI